MRHNVENEEKATLESEDRNDTDPKNCNRNLVSDQILILNPPRSKNLPTSCQIFLQNIHGLHSTIPKHITSLDEKYALRCLELISNYAKRSALQNFNLKVDISPCGSLSLTEPRNRNSCEAISLSFKHPQAFVTDQFMVNSSAVSQNQRAINILNSPVIQQFVSLDSDANFDRTSLRVTRESTASPIIESCHKLRKEATFLDHSLASVPSHERVASASSSNSSSSENSSWSRSSGMYQGMLQCKWKDGIPEYAFTVDDRSEIYTANLSKIESSSSNKFLDYIYNFCSRKSRGELDLESVGSMEVSSSVTVCSDDSEVVDTRFILSLSNESRREEVQTSNCNLKKKTRLLKKVRSAFRLSQSYNHRSEPSEDTKDILDACLDITERECNQNFESAAIVVKNRVFNNSQVLDNGGWGMKFLKKHGNGTFSHGSMPRKRAENSTECSTMIDVIIPAGFHGGSRARTGGPSSLVERWTSGGSCDCGGWDIGCPLTILNTKSSYHDSIPSADNSNECNTTELFIQGSKKSMPVMKMVNIHNGMYYIHSQSSLSILQSFAIAAAIIHSGSPVLRSRLCRS